MTILYLKKIRYLLVDISGAMQHIPGAYFEYATFQRKYNARNLCFSILYHEEAFIFRPLRLQVDLVFLGRGGRAWRKALASTNLGSTQNKDPLWTRGPAPLFVLNEIFLTELFDCAAYYCF